MVQAFQQQPVDLGSTMRRPSRYSARCHAGVFPGRCEQVKGSFSQVEKTIS
jgi:hypothetical protein